MYTPNINLEPLIHLLFYMRSHTSPYQNIHVALDFYHVRLDVITQIDKLGHVHLSNIPLFHLY